MDGYEHFVNLIETCYSHIYYGPRLTVFHTLKEAEQDMLDWLNDNHFMEADRETDVKRAMLRYREETECFCKIEPSRE